METEISFLKNEVFRGRGIVDTVLASVQAHQAQIATLRTEKKALEAEVSKLNKKLNEAKQRVENERTSIDDNQEIGNSDAPFLGCHDLTEAKFVERVQDAIALICYKKAQKTNWSAAQLMHRISQSTVLAKRRETNGRNASVEYQTYRYKRQRQGTSEEGERAGQ